MSESKSERSHDGRGKPYDLEDRTAVFGENVIGFVRKIPVNAVTRRLIDPLVGAAGRFRISGFGLPSVLGVSRGRRSPGGEGGSFGIQGASPRLTHPHHPS